jgi:hypothetical protein
MKSPFFLSKGCCKVCGYSINSLLWMDSVRLTVCTIHVPLTAICLDWIKHREFHGVSSLQSLIRIPHATGSSSAKSHWVLETSFEMCISRIRLPFTFCGELVYSDMSVCADGLQCDFHTGDPIVMPFLARWSNTQGLDAPHAQPM